GTSTILIESGGWKDDTEKQFIRKINFIGMLSAFLSIANNSYLETSTGEYEAIPMNENHLFDLLLTNITVERNGQKFPLDIAVNVSEENIDSGSAFTSYGLIEDLGDLSVFNGIDEMDCSGLSLKEAKVYIKKVETEKVFSEIDFQKLVEDGIGYLPVQKALIHSKNRSPLYEKFPVCLVDDPDYQFKLKIGEQPAFYLYKNDTPKYAVLGGKIIRMHNTK
ncbi:MAG: peptidase M14, partial [Ignavibacteria bacterium]|nr:peptidase M14 [Ignavibacteria bacterium]